MPTLYDDVFIAGTGLHLPGPPIDNEAMDAFIAPLNRISGRIKQRILAENGIRTRHYAIDADGRTRESNAQMASAAIRAALADAGCELSAIDLLACGTSGGDSIMPGFANMVQGELGAPPMATHTSVGVCAASLGALAFAAGQVQQGDARRALAVGSDLPSRMFKRTRFAPRGYEADFNAHFLRWMLSDGAAALVLAHRDELRRRHAAPAPEVGAPEVVFGRPPGVHAVGPEPRRHAQLSRLREFQRRRGRRRAGAAPGHPPAAQPVRHRDPRVRGAGAAGAGRSEARRSLSLPLLVGALPACRRRADAQGRTRDPASALVDQPAQPRQHRRGQPVRDAVGVREHARAEGGRADLLLRARVRAASRWRMRCSRWSGRGRGRSRRKRVPSSRRRTRRSSAAPHDAAAATDPRLARLLQSLAEVWHDYRSAAWRTPLVRLLTQRRFTQHDYVQWMACWIPQVREGSRWMREAIASMRAPYAALGDLVETHASEEQFDFKHPVRRLPQRRRRRAQHRRPCAAIPAAKR